MKILDCHTHNLQATGAVISVDPRAFAPLQGRYYSVGFHPWTPESELSAADYALLETVARHEQVVAIGETGMDRLRGDDLATQQERFRRHIALADALGKPIIIHCVRTMEEVLRLWQAMAPHRALPIVHGFRGNARRARRWVDAGFYLSFGAKFDEGGLLATPVERRLAESDEGDFAATLRALDETPFSPFDKILTQTYI